MSRLSPGLFENWRPRPRVNSWEWINKHVRHWYGDAFNGDNVPWCKGVCEAFDDPAIREIDLQWATRLGKTFISHALLLCTSATRPMPIMFGSATETLARGMIREKVYEMLARCHPLKRELRPKSRRSTGHVDLKWCSWRVAWSGSETSLADFSAWLLHCNEIDKWDTSASREADPVELFAERCKEFPDYKAIFEGTPTEVGYSRIERRRLNGTDSRFWVPCPHCGRFQVLKMGDGNAASGGIIWDHGPDGHSDPDLAYNTARYRCAYCPGEIHDEQRATMMRGGVWAANGQHVDKQGRVKGRAKRNGEVWSSQLSSLYSLQLRWGQIASKWCKTFRRPSERQNFINSWLGETFTVAQSFTKPEELGARLAGEHMQGEVPKGVAFLTAGCDRQIDHWVYWVNGWGPEERGYQIDYGTVPDDAALAEVLQRRYKTKDLSREFPISLALLDSGDETEAVYSFCKQHSTPQLPILPCKGTALAIGGHSYKKSILGENRNRTQRRAALSARGQLLILVPNDYWQPVLQRYFDECVPGDPDSLTLCHEAKDDLDLAEQLLNEIRKPSIDSRGHRKMIWQMKDQDAANDFRDALKYCRCAAEVWLKGRWGAVPLAAERAGLPPDIKKPPLPEEVREKERVGAFVRRRPVGVPFVRRSR